MEQRDITFSKLVRIPCRNLRKKVNNSPAEKAGLRAYFDFILAVNDTRLDQESNLLADVISKGVDSSISLAVYSAKSQDVRQILVTPSNSWGGTPADGVLGCVVRFCSFDQLDQHCWRVLEVHEGSPTHAAGLTADADYIIGSANAVLKDRDDFFHLVESFAEKPLRLFVYNTVFDSCREVQIVPSRSWGGDGLLGCSLGYGYLHKLSQSNSAVKQQVSQDAKPAVHSHSHGDHSHEDGHPHDHPHDHSHYHSHDGHFHEAHSHDGHSHDHPREPAKTENTVQEPPHNSDAVTIQAEPAKEADPNKLENESIL